MLKVHSVPEYPFCDCIQSQIFLSHFEAQPHITRTLGVRIQPHFQAAGIDVEGISNDTLHTLIYSWPIPAPVVRFDLTNLKKSETD